MHKDEVENQAYLRDDVAGISAISFEIESDRRLSFDTRVGGL